jgi:hypothetical protein
MKPRLLYQTASPCLLIQFSTGCAKELSCEECLTNPAPVGGDQLLIALAGLDQSTTLPKESVVLYGSASNDPDGYITISK